VRRAAWDEKFARPFLDRASTVLAPAGEAPPPVAERLVFAGRASAGRARLGTILCSERWAATAAACAPRFDVNDDLDQLLEAEKRLALRLDEARQAAARVLEVARAEAGGLAARTVLEEQASRERIATETQAELKTQLALIASQADAAVQRYAEMDDRRLRELSLLILRSLLEETTAVPR